MVTFLTAYSSFAPLGDLLGQQEVTPFFFFHETRDGSHTLTASHNGADDDGTNNSGSTVVTVDAPSTGGIELMATGYKVKGVKHAELMWNGAVGTNVNVHRDGVSIAETANDGMYIDNSGQKGGGTFTYQVCETGTSTCSNEVTVTF